MKKATIPNPETISQSSLNLPSIDSNTNYQSYQNQKKARKQAENQRKMLELTVAALRRQAYQASKQFNSTQESLMFVYNKKLSTLDECNKKNQIKRQEQEQLLKRKNFSNLTRYLHQIKKQQALQTLHQHRKNTISQMKSYLEQSNQIRSKQRKEQRQQLTQRSRRMSQTNRSNVKWAKSKNYRQKKKMSEYVRNQLKSIEESRIAQENQRIEMLEAERRRILDMLDKSRQKNGELQSMKDELSSMDIHDFESRVVKNGQQSRITVATRKIQKSKKKKQQQKNHDNFYY